MLSGNTRPLWRDETSNDPVAEPCGWTKHATTSMDESGHLSHRTGGLSYCPSSGSYRTSPPKSGTSSSSSAQPRRQHYTNSPVMQRPPSSNVSAARNRSSGYPNTTQLREQVKMRTKVAPGRGGGSPLRVDTRWREDHGEASFAPLSAPSLHENRDLHSWVPSPLGQDEVPSVEHIVDVSARQGVAVPPAIPWRSSSSNTSTEDGLNAPTYGAAHYQSMNPARRAVSGVPSERPAAHTTRDEGDADAQLSAHHGVATPAATTAPIHTNHHHNISYKPCGTSPPPAQTSTRKPRDLSLSECAAESKEDPCSSMAGNSSTGSSARSPKRRSCWWWSRLSHEAAITTTTTTTSGTSPVAQDRMPSMRATASSLHVEPLVETFFGWGCEVEHNGQRPMAGPLKVATLLCCRHVSAAQATGWPRLARYVAESELVERATQTADAATSGMSVCAVESLVGFDRGGCEVAKGCPLALSEVAWGGCTTSSLSGAEPSVPLAEPGTLSDVMDNFSARGILLWAVQAAYKALLRRRVELISRRQATDASAVDAEWRYHEDQLELSAYLICEDAAGKRGNASVRCLLAHLPPTTDPSLVVGGHEHHFSPDALPDGVLLQPTTIISRPARSQTDCLTLMGYAMDNVERWWSATEGYDAQRRGPTNIVFNLHRYAVYVSAAKRATQRVHVGALQLMDVGAPRPVSWSAHTLREHNECTLAVLRHLSDCRANTYTAGKSSTSPLDVSPRLVSTIALGNPTHPLHHRPLVVIGEHAMLDCDELDAPGMKTADAFLQELIHLGLRRRRRLHPAQRIAPSPSRTREVKDATTPPPTIIIKTRGATPEVGKGRSTPRAGRAPSPPSADPRRMSDRSSDSIPRLDVLARAGCASDSMIEPKSVATPCEARPRSPLPWSFAASAGRGGEAAPVLAGRQASPIRSRPALPDSQEKRSVSAKLVSLRERLAVATTPRGLPTSFYSATTNTTITSSSAMRTPNRSRFGAPARGLSSHRSPVPPTIHIESHPYQRTATHMAHSMEIPTMIGGDARMQRRNESWTEEELRRELIEALERFVFPPPSANNGGVGSSSDGCVVRGTRSPSPRRPLFGSTTTPHEGRPHLHLADPDPVDRHNNQVLMATAASAAEPISFRRQLTSGYLPDRRRLLHDARHAAFNQGNRPGSAQPFARTASALVCSSSGAQRQQRSASAGRPTTPRRAHEGNARRPGVMSGSITTSRRAGPPVRTSTPPPRFGVARQQSPIRAGHSMLW